MNEADIEVFEKLAGQLDGALAEMSVLARKKPDAPLNTFKLDLVNKVLASANDLLRAEYRPFPDFERFDSDDIPQNSDVVFVLAQYRECLEHFRSQNIGLSSGRWVWLLDDGSGGRVPSNRRVAPPQHLKKK